MGEEEEIETEVRLGSVDELGDWDGSAREFIEAIEELIEGSGENDLRLVLDGDFNNVEVILKRF